MARQVEHMAYEEKLKKMWVGFCGWLVWFFSQVLKIDKAELNSIA